MVTKRIHKRLGKFGWLTLGNFSSRTRLWWNLWKEYSHINTIFHSSSDREKCRWYLSSTVHHLKQLTVFWLLQPSSLNPNITAKGSTFHYGYSPSKVLFPVTVMSRYLFSYKQPSDNCITLWILINPTSFPIHNKAQIDQYMTGTSKYVLDLLMGQDATIIGFYIPIERNHLWKRGSSFMGQ